MDETRSAKFASEVRACLISGPGLPGRLVLASGMAGGIVLGGFLVALPAMINPLVVTAGADVTQFMFLAGTLLGLLHGSVLGVLGRSADMSRRRAAAAAIAGLIWAIPAVLVSFMITLWISISRWAIAVHQPFLIGGAALGWVAGAVVCGWCAREAWRAVSNAVQRWPERRWGAVLGITTFTVLLVALVIIRPEIWWTNARVSAAGAALLALGITIWAALPVEVVLLHLAMRHRHLQSA